MFRNNTLLLRRNLVILPQLSVDTDLRKNVEFINLKLEDVNIQVSMMEREGSMQQFSDNV